MSVFGNYDADPGMKQQGSRCPSLEMLGLHPLPCTSNCFEIGFLRQPAAAMIAKWFTRQRISMATEPSAACGLSCAGGLELLVPI
jgi:hypothetical protein